MLFTICTGTNGAHRKLLARLGLTKEIASVLTTADTKRDMYWATKLFSVLARSYLKENASSELCPYCITQVKEDLLPADKEVGEALSNGKVIEAIINKNTYDNDGLMELLEYMSWDNSAATCAIIEQLFLPSSYFTERLAQIKGVMGIKDNLKKLRIRLVFSSSMTFKKPCGIFSVIRNKSRIKESDIKNYLKFISDCASKDPEILQFLVSSKKTDLICLEEMALKEMETELKSRQRARELFYTNEVNFGVPQTIAAERYGLSPHTELVDMPTDEFCAAVMEFKTVVSNHLIAASTRKEEAAAATPEKLLEDNAHLREIYSYLVLRKDRPLFNNSPDERGAEVIGSKVAKLTSLEPLKATNTKETNDHKRPGTPPGTRYNKSEGGSPRKQSNADIKEMSDEEKLDTLVSVTGRSKSEAKAALQKHNGNIDAAAADLLG